ncbi:hypothetical protein ASPWEDRAFT_32265 [Aspergillus wentii DTO 134E9]|uniref:N,O-diacetylmuramidase n=1 Tax=Aspergillus wentii DTO 134E9 TaxID=1073089 RepID=A0A1L9R9P5_ASPWE|nr:uncharacterized protein ASPWEDRAFT_32265 [Aspergillus wentii DTO 134E9]KAI9926318.1 hypothetical protein MW887_004082 [Aspergillus wentii]OJJ31651.1 hypothetical protein ASPWEDRAFT_32265 [Aspergillus wentii DTO 134E9]
MKLSAIASVAAISGLSQALPQLETRADTVQGFDISNHQAKVDFAAAYKDGARFVVSKATEGTGFTDDYYKSHTKEATEAGLIHGAYHFARPDKSSGKAQAVYFIKNGGDWKDDGKTLPGMLDIEYNPYGHTCYDLSDEKMVAWIEDFVSTYHEQTKRYPLLYTTADWWNKCTGNSKKFADTPLVLASYSSSPPKTIPGSWETYTIWQNSNKYKHGGDSDLFNGGLGQLKKIVSGK